MAATPDSYQGSGAETQPVVDRPDRAEIRGEEIVVNGVAASPGIAIGEIYLLRRDDGDADDKEIPEGEVEQELERFENAVQHAERALRSIISVTREKLGPESSAIFEAQQMMLRDESLYEAVVERIRSKCASASHAIDRVMTEHRQRLEASDSPYLRQRSDDLLEVQQRLITHLRRGELLTSVPPDTVVISQTLSAAELMLFSRRGILGCALDYSGATSHVAIMARALGLPSVVSLHNLSERACSGDLVILDGIRGRVILRPDDETLSEYQNRQQRFQEIRTEQRALAPLPAKTTDGIVFNLEANIELSEEADLMEEHGATGIGLVRTEVLLLMKGSLSQSEESQYQLYRALVEKTAPHTTTLRVVDLGGDKMLPLAHRESNPFLGWRGIRVLLDKPDLLGPQLRALLRASAHGPVRILVPMVTSLDEMTTFRRHVREAEADLQARGVPFADDVPVGIMVEVPAVALMAAEFAEVADFFSIGSNDLTQYTLAVDRGNDLVAKHYEEIHPAVLRLIQMTVEAAREHDIPVSMCGEAAGNPVMAPIFLGLGVDTLSASPIYIPGVKRLIRSISFADAQALATEALEARDPQQVRAQLREWFEMQLGHLPLGLDGQEWPERGSHVAASS